MAINHVGERMQLLATPRAPEVSLREQLIQLGRGLRNCYAGLYARQFKGVFELKWGSGGTWFKDHSGIARAMAEKSISLIQFLQVKTANEIADFFEALINRGEILQNRNIDATIGTVIIEQATPKLPPLEWETLIAQAEYKKPDWEGSLSQAVEHARGVLADPASDADTLFTARVRLTLYRIPILMSTLLQRIINVPELDALIAALRSRQTTGQTT
jgi:hypothetical protein